MVIRAIWIAGLVGLLLGLALGGGGAASAGPTLGPVAATRYSLVDAMKVEHASLSVTTYTREVVLAATDADGMEVAGPDGGQLDINALTHTFRLSAPHGVDVFGGVPLVVEGGPGAIVDAQGFAVSGTPGITITIPWGADGYQRYRGGIIVAAHAPTH